MAPGIEAAASPHGRAAAAAAVAAYYQQGSGYPEAAAAVAGKIHALQMWNCNYSGF